MINASEKGETLVEAIIALAVVVAIATGIVVAVFTSLNGTTFNQNANFALDFAQESQDVVKDLASSNYSTFKTNYPTQTYYMSDDDLLTSTNTIGGNANVPSSNPYYMRTVYINQSGQSPAGATLCSGSTFVRSIVTWTDGKCKNGNFCHDVELDSCVSNLSALTNP